MDADRLRALLGRFPHLTVLVVGDFFLDKYLDIDPQLSERSLETGLPAYQVVGVRRYAGAAGTVANNLRALDVTVIALGLVGDDGDGDDLRRALGQSGVDGDGLIRAPGCLTPTYLKPLLHTAGVSPRELNRFDTKNRSVLPVELEREVIARLRHWVPRVAGVVIADQVTEPNCGVITDRVREVLGELARGCPTVTMAADSRERIGEFRDVIVKPNAREALRASGMADVAAAGRELLRRTGQPVVVTLGEHGMRVFEPQGDQHVPAVPVAGPIDIVGAGDSAMAGLVAARCAGGSLAEAALVGNLVASITIEQLGVTGTASRAQVQARFGVIETRGIA